MTTKLNNITLESRINFAINYVHKRKLTSQYLQNYLADALTRFSHQYQDKDTLLDILKISYFNTNLKSRQQELISKYNLITLSETNKLLLTRAVYLEDKYAKN